MSDDVEGVRGRLEALFGGEVGHHRGDGAFEAGARRDVDDLAAERAEQVVMVMREILGELESRELVVRGDASNDAGELQIREMAVGGASRHVRQRVEMSEMLIGRPNVASSVTTAWRPDV